MMEAERNLEEIREILERFINAGFKEYFKMKDDDYYQGYAFEVDHDTLYMWDSGPFAAEEQLEIPIADIDLTTLAYWDETKERWVDFEAR